MLTIDALEQRVRSMRTHWTSAGELHALLAAIADRRRAISDEQRRAIVAAATLHVPEQRIADSLGVSRGTVRRTLGKS